MKSVQSNQRKHRNSKEHEQVSGMHVISSIKRTKRKKKERKKERIHTPRFTGITRLSNSRIDGRIAPALSQKQQTLAQRQRLFLDMMLEDCQDCILVGRAGHLLQTADCNSTRTSRISIRGGGKHVQYRIYHHKTINFSEILVSLRSNFRKSDSGNILEIFSQSVNFRNIFIISGEEHL